MIGVSRQYISKLAKKEKIKGAIRIGNNLMIPIAWVKMKLQIKMRNDNNDAR